MLLTSSMLSEINRIANVLLLLLGLITACEWVFLSELRCNNLDTLLAWWPLILVSWLWLKIASNIFKINNINTIVFIMTLYVLKVYLIMRLYSSKRWLGFPVLIILSSLIEITNNLTIIHAIIWFQSFSARNPLSIIFTLLTTLIQFILTSTVFVKTTIWLFALFWWVLWGWWWLRELIYLSLKEF